MNPVKFGVIGVGGMGGSHARSMTRMEETQLVAVADVNEANAQALARETGAEAYRSAEDLIEKAGVEAVLIATPHFFHPPVAELAAAHGLHVLTEKPIAVTVSAADRMIEACRKAGVLLGVAFNHRTEPVKKKMHDLIAAGEIGEIYRVSMSVIWYRTATYYRRGASGVNWNSIGGGILIEQAPHQLDLLAWMGGMPKSVLGIAGTRWHEIEVENTSVSILNYGDGKLGWFYASTAEASGMEDRYEIAGDRGALVMEAGKLRRYGLSGSLLHHLRTSPEMADLPPGNWSEVEVEPHSFGHHEVVRAFAVAVRENDPSKMVASGEDGLRSLELSNAMLLSGLTRREVSLPVDRDAMDQMLRRLQDGAKIDDFRTPV